MKRREATRSDAKQREASRKQRASTAKRREATRSKAQTTRSNAQATRKERASNSKHCGATRIISGWWDRVKGMVMNPVRIPKQWLPRHVHSQNYLVHVSVVVRAHLARLIMAGQLISPTQSLTLLCFLRAQLAAVVFASSHGHHLSVVPGVITRQAPSKDLVFVVGGSLRLLPPCTYRAAFVCAPVVSKHSLLLSLSH